MVTHPNTWPASSSAPRAAAEPRRRLVERHGAAAPKILAAAIGIAVAATIGMGAGQYLSDGERNIRKAWVMAAATLIGSVLPALPFMFGTSEACVLTSIGITVIAAGVIGHYRGYLVTYSILVVVSVITVVLSVTVA